MNLCNGGGHLVGGNAWLPVDPGDYFRAAYSISDIGCNRLRCQRCGQMVRHALGYAVAPAFDAATLFAMRDWSVLTGAVPDGREQGRLYVCACNVLVEHAGCQLDQSGERDPDILPPWRCAGHPGLRPPGTIAGVDVELSNGWAPLVAAHLERTTALHPSVDRFPGFMLTRIYQALEALSDQEALACAVADRAADTSLRARQAVALFYALNHRAAGLDRVLVAWRAEPDLYYEHPGAFGPGSLLKDTLLEAIAFRIGSRQPAADELLATWRWAALHGSGLGVHLHSAARTDAAWTQEHVEQLLDVAPADWKTILHSIRVVFPLRLVDGLRRAIACGHATREQVAAALTEHYREKADPVIAAL